MLLAQISRRLTRAIASLAVGALALGAGPAFGQLTTIGDGVTSLPGPISACPGGAAVRADYFTLQSDTAGDFVTKVKVQLLPSGAFAAIKQVDIRNSAGTVTYGSAIPVADAFDVALATTFAVSTASATEYSIFITPQSFGAIPTSLGSISAKVNLVFNRFMRTGSDTTSAAVVLDAAPPSDVSWTSLAATTNQITLNFAAPVDPGGVTSIIVLRDTKPVVDAPVAPNLASTYGAVGATFSGGTSRIVYAASSTALLRVSDTTATGLVAGTSYYYKAYVRDACGNWSPGQVVGPIVAGVTTEGDSTPNSLKPMVGILNPISGGVVGSRFRVQVRIFSPKNGVTTQPITLSPAPVLNWRRSDGVSGSATLVQNTNYGSATDSGVFEPSPILSLAPGSYTIQASAANGPPTTAAKSAVVPIIVGAGKGDGNLLRRDNSSQLCSDCHATATHSSETTSNKYGAWFNGCRACHQPHGTPNAELIATDITPPQVAGQFAPTKVFFSAKSGYDPAGGATNSTSQSLATYANGDRTGACQVCHTRTKWYTRAGAPGDGGPANTQGSGSHGTGDCAQCHKHSSGFTGGGCTSCHGDATDLTRNVTGADPLVSAAPPKDHLNNTLATFAGVGTHRSHVVGSRFRAPLQCAECHTNPGASPHPSGGAGQVTMQTVDCDWGRGGITCTPQSAYASPTCSNTYCHGNFNGALYIGGAPASMTWNNGSTVTCGSCHGIPPANPAHSGVTSAGPCNTCHPSGYTPAVADPTYHMNGQLDASGCNGCHGSTTRVSNWKNDSNPTIASTFTDVYVGPMPPKDATAAHNTATSSIGVGAHDTHVNKAVVGARSYPYQCTTCHVAIPTDPSHGSTWNPANITSAVGWNRTNATCNNTCHSKPNAATANPVWTTVTGTLQQNCGSCHGTPPPVADRGHPSNSNCQSCHPAYGGVNYDATAKTAPYQTHANSTINMVFSPNTGCARCHGVLGGGAPNTALYIAPGYAGSATVGLDTHGVSLVTTVTVGAHDLHLRPTYSSSFGCVNCHQSTLPTDTTHADGVIAQGWSALASSTYAAGAALPTSYTGFTASSNCTVYCHSNASPVNGLRSTTGSPAWTNTAKLACNGCHAFQADAVLNPSSTNLSHGHYKHTSTTGGYSLNCSECHNTVATGTAGSPGTGTITNPANHVNGSHTLAFNAAKNNAAGVGYVQAPTYQCSNTYCHSNGSVAMPGAPANTSLAWTGTTNCGSCHPQGTAMNSGKHTQHLNNATVLGDTGYHCSDCHAGTTPVGVDTAMIGTATHVNGSRNVIVAARGSQATNVTASATCSGIYCHSSGQRGAARKNATVNWTDAAWGAGGAVCNKCHGTNGVFAGTSANSYGAPDYANGGQNTATANSHAAHVGGPGDCVVCHKTTVQASGTAILAGGVHLGSTGTIDVSFTTSAGTSPVPSSSPGNGSNVSATCSNIACHGGNPVTWGGPSQQCRNCHFGASGSANSDLNDYVYLNGTMAKIDPDDWGTFGHGAVNNFVESANTASNFDRNGATAIDGCMYCHDTAANGVPHGMANNPFRLRNISGPDGKLGVCLACHKPNAASWSPAGLPAKMPVTRIDSVHYGAGHAGAGAGGQYCWDCHDAHGDYNYSANQRLAYMIRENPVKNHAATTLPGDWGQPTVLADTPDFRKNRSAGGIAGAWDWTDYVSSTSVGGTTPYRGVCQVCHTPANTNHFNMTTSEDAHPGGAICTSCHAHEQTATTAFTGSGDCVGCHSTLKAITKGPLAGTRSRRAVALEFNNTWSHKRSGGKTPTKWDCIVCHMEGDMTTGSTTAGHMNGYIDLRDPDTGTTIENVYWTGSGAGGYVTTTVTANRYLSYPEFRRNLSSSTIEPVAAAIMINQCLKCHDSNGAVSTKAQVPGGSAGKPFGTTITGAGYNAVNGLTACTVASGINGCVVDVDASFATTNATYHPIKGKQNNDFVSASKLNAPYNTANAKGNAGSTANWGILITCWDCHAPNNASGLQTSTVTAHGGPVTLRQDVWVNSAVSNGGVGAGNLCRVCHVINAASTNNHGTGSAWNSGGSGTPGSRAKDSCYYCHASNYTASTGPGRPGRAEDVHGYDTFSYAAVATGDTMWPAGATNNTYKPYGFMRSVSGSGGVWSSASWSPKSAPGMTTGSGGVCGATQSPCSNSNGTYTPGGVY